MIYENLFNASALPTLEQVVNFTQARNNVLAGNIANMDTPGYKARDLDVDAFQSRLRASIEQRNRPLGMTSPGLFASDQRTADLASDPNEILYHDQSNDSVEYQVSEMVKNQLQHNLALTIMVKQMQLLQTAISERV